MMPSTAAGSGAMKPQAGVMATRPATAPDEAPTSVGLPSRSPLTTVPPGRAGAGAAAAARLRAGVEAEPAEPEQAGAERHERHVVRLHDLAGPADALAEHQDQ